MHARRYCNYELVFEEFLPSANAEEFSKQCRLFSTSVQGLCVPIIHRKVLSQTKFAKNMIMNEKCVVYLVNTLSNIF